MRVRRLLFLLVNFGVAFLFTSCAFFVSSSLALCRIAASAAAFVSSAGMVVVYIGK